MNRRMFLGMLGLGAAVGLVAKSMPSPPVNRMPYFVGTKGRVYFEPAIGPYRAINTVYYPALAANAQAYPKWNGPVSEFAPISPEDFKKLRQSICDAMAVRRL